MRRSSTGARERHRTAAGARRVRPAGDLAAFSAIEGVAQVQVFGSQKYAVRVQLDPDTLAARGIGVDEVQTAVAAANSITPVGTLRNLQQSLAIQATTDLSTADQFRNIIVAVSNGRPVRLGDFALVTGRRE